MVSTEMALTCAVMIVLTPIKAFLIELHQQQVMTLRYSVRIRVWRFIVRVFKEVFPTILSSFLEIACRGVMSCVGA